MSKTVAITGSTGLVGKALVDSLLAKGCTVRRITTGQLPTIKDDKQEYYKWDPSRGALDPNVFKGCDAVVHLAGENIASGSLESPFALLGAWTDAKKAKILSSRVEGTKLVVDTINNMQPSSRPKVLVSASAVGYYGYNSDKVFDENYGQGDGFLAQVVREWESEALKCSIRTVCTRLGVVLSPDGGIVSKLKPIFKLAAGGNLGNGNQGFSFVSVEDTVNAIQFAIENRSVAGPINVCSPQPVTNAEFTQAMGKAVNRPAIIPVPEFVGNIVFGEMGREVLFGGQKAVPNKLTSAGFKFQDVDISSTLDRLLNK